MEDSPHGPQIHYARPHIAEETLAMATRSHRAVNRFAMADGTLQQQIIRYKAEQNGEICFVHQYYINKAEEIFTLELPYDEEFDHRPDKH